MTSFWGVFIILAKTTAITKRTTNTTKKMKLKEKKKKQRSRMLTEEKKTANPHSNSRWLIFFDYTTPSVLKLMPSQPNVGVT